MSPSTPLEPHTSPAPIRPTRSRRGLRQSAIVLCSIMAMGCASGGGGGSGGGSFQLLTGDQIRETDATNLWDALRRLRPQWLRARATTSLVGPSMAAEPVVYVQGIRYGELRDLQRMNVDVVRQVEFIDAADATTRFGTGHSGGVIMVDLDR